MANFAIPSTPPLYDPYQSYLDKFEQGRKIGKDIQQVRANREYGRAVAAAPEAGQGIPMDTEQTDMLQEQTEGMFDEGALPDAPMAAAEQETQKSTQKRQRLTTKQWADWRKRVMDAAAETGDPDKVKEASKYVTDYQHEGFMKNLDMASAYMGQGDLATAAKYLEDAHEYMPNDRSAKFSVQGDNIVMEMTREGTDEPAGMMVLNKQNLPAFVENFRDPAKFAYWNWENRYRESEEQRKQSEFEYDVSRRGAKEEMAAAKLDTEKAQAEKERATADYYRQREGSAGGGGGRWGPKEKNQALQEVADARSDLSREIRESGGMAYLREKRPELATEYEAEFARLDKREREIRAVPIEARVPQRPSRGAIPAGGSGGKQYQIDQTATNPQTGEQMRWNGKGWEPVP